MSFPEEAAAFIRAQRPDSSPRTVEHVVVGETGIEAHLTFEMKTGESVKGFRERVDEGITGNANSRTLTMPVGVFNK